MRIIRYRGPTGLQLAAVTDEDTVFGLTDTDFLTLIEQAAATGVTPLNRVREQIDGAAPLSGDWRQLDLAAPLDAPEVWGAGVTYERSKEARNEEAGGDRPAGTLTCYDKVYDAARPELFLKSTAARTVGPGDAVCLRSDSKWQVPEPELGLVLDRHGRIVGYTAGNDMSCRDIEGENPLYLPQAKIWRRSCAIGPAIRLAETVDNPYDLSIDCKIYRGDRLVVHESATTGKLKRKLEELVAYLLKDNVIFDGTVLLTGTGIVPPGHFTLEPGDKIEVAIDGIGTLTNVAEPARAQLTAN